VPCFKSFTDLAPVVGSSGSCPGYVIDHVNPLECGGADAPFNLQLQTIADGKQRTSRTQVSAVSRRVHTLDMYV